MLSNVKNFQELKDNKHNVFNLLSSFSEDENLSWSIDLEVNNTSQENDSLDLQQECIIFSKLTRGVAMKYKIDEKFFKLFEFNTTSKSLSLINEIFNDDYNGKIILGTKNEEENSIKFENLSSLARQIETIAKKGVTMQRFKGLGEMNPEQLWETTLDPNARTLLKVTIDDTERANETFSTLMGDVVEPRRNFIIDNALKVDNLDA